jgi:hypothetical protein
MARAPPVIQGGIGGASGSVACGLRLAGRKLACPSAGKVAGLTALEFYGFVQGGADFIALFQRKNSPNRRFVSIWQAIRQVFVRAVGRDRGRDDHEPRTEHGHG